MSEVTIQDVRKALEDLVYANLIDIFMVKYGETTLAPGDNSIALPGDPYDDTDDYIVEAVEAFDTNEINIAAALLIKDKTTTGFVVESPRLSTLRWRSMRKLPKINFWTP